MDPISSSPTQKRERRTRLLRHQNTNALILGVADVDQRGGVCQQLRQLGVVGRRAEHHQVGALLLTDQGELCSTCHVDGILTGKGLAFGGSGSVVGNLDHLARQSRGRRWEHQEEQCWGQEAGEVRHPLVPAKRA